VIKKFDILAIDNPLIDYTLNVNDLELHTKYGLKPGSAGNANESQKALFNLVKKSKEKTPGGCSLNSIRSAAFELK
jgi:hypothetical protein